MGLLESEEIVLAVANLHCRITRRNVKQQLARQLNFLRAFQGHVPHHIVFVLSVDQQRGQGYWMQ